jgi:dihydrofolate reductase
MKMDNCIALQSCPRGYHDDKARADRRYEITFLRVSLACFFRVSSAPPCELRSAPTSSLQHCEHSQSIQLHVPSLLPTTISTPLVALRAMSNPPTTQPSNAANTQSSTANSARTIQTAMSSPKSLTLILAATPSLGIGKSGGLPWPQLRKEMGYFARVTKRTSPHSIAQGDGVGEIATQQRRVNAVVMGRKTWDSIPPKFRPLKGRVNVVVTRNVDAFRSQLPASTHAAKAGDGKGEEVEVEGPLVASSVSDALSQLDSAQADVDKVFVIGGASIYQQALELKESRHVLLTKIQREYECDTFFGEDLEGGKWRKASFDELKEFTGEDLGEQAHVEEQGVSFEFCLYNRVD